MLRDLIRSYRKIEHPILFMIIAEFFIQLINASFMAIQPLYMNSEGFSDGLTAGYISFRFLGILLLAFPIGLLLKGRKLKPLFYISGFCVPAFALLIIFAIHLHIPWLINTAQFCWGASFTFLQISALPFILRYAKKETHTEAIALSYSTWSLGGIIGGSLIGVLNTMNPVLFNERNLLIIISMMGFMGIYFIYKIKINEDITPVVKRINNPVASPNFANGESTGPYHWLEQIRQRFSGGLSFNISEFDWPLITRALLPTLVIAIGAGLTIPFMSLFFANVHHMSTGIFSAISAITSVLVAIGAMMVPVIKREFGYKKAIPVTQSLSVIVLVLLATTQYYSHLSIAVYIAAICFMVRQPLMNLAGPMTSEVIMNYVGAKNREMVSALTSAIWSGTWFISSLIFKYLREEGLAYVNVFLITATLYAVGVIWYYFLVSDYEKKEKAGFIQKD